MYQIRRSQEKKLKKFSWWFFKSLETVFYVKVKLLLASGQKKTSRIL